MWPSQSRRSLTQRCCHHYMTLLQVVQVCAEHKKPAKLLKHLGAVKEAGAQMRNPPRVLVFANRVKVG